MSPTIREQVHPLLRDLLPPLFDEPGIVENKATCDRCVMCAPPGQEKSQARDFFHPDIKCCTYQPRMPNFLVGAILADETEEEGKRRVRALIARRSGVTPQWLAPSRRYAVLMEAGRYHGFGRALSMRCPFFDDTGKNCSIWRYRKSDCAVFYCKYDAGADGQAYWRALGAYWHRLETRISALVMKQVSDAVVEPDLPKGKMSVEELEDRPPKAEDYTRWWGPFEGKEEELYRACFERVRALGPDDVAAIQETPGATKQLQVIADTHRQLVRPRVPATLVKNPEIESFPGPEGTHLLVTYSRYEPMAVPDLLHELLAEFDGKATVAEVQKRILDQHDADFSDALVLALFQQRILVSAQ